jgi:hypothetical protein
LGDTEEEAVAECKELYGDDDDDVDDSDDLDYVEVDTLTAPRVEMIIGYAHEYAEVESDEEDMELVVYTPKGSEAVYEYRKIDGSWHVVFHCPDGKYRAQLCVALGVQNPI